MCGIGGIIRRGANPRFDKSIGYRMINSLKHRGPDGHNLWIDDHALLIHTRLAIVDLTTGRQPLTNEDGSVVVTFNGEIYNSPELRRMLQARGHVFRTHTDTEVLVHLYEEYNLEMCNYLKGMFAFAIWDARKKRLVLVRDRFGIKPLYYAHADDYIVFGSQPCAIVATFLVPWRMDPKAIPSYLYYGYIAPWRSIYEGISKLAPGHCLVWHADRSTVDIQRYCRFPSPTTMRANPEIVYGVTRNYISKAVTSSLMSDVPIGLALSGGLDSSILAYHIKGDHNLDPLTFTLRWDNMLAKDPEWELAQALSRHLGLRSLSTVVQDNMRDALAEIYQTLDEPLGDSSVVPLYMLCRYARSYVKVLLTGDGGDELFGGYRRYLANAYEWRLSQLLPCSVVRLLTRNQKVLERLGVVRWKRKWCRFLDRLLLAPGLRYAVSLGQVPLAVILTWITPSLGRFLLEDLEMLSALWDDCKQED